MRFSRALLASTLLLVAGARTSEKKKLATEAARRLLRDSPAACPHTAADGDALRVAMALRADGSLEESHACLLHHLSKSSAASWSAAAAFFDDTHISEHARELLGGKPCTPSPASWDVIGPLPIGKNEIDADPLAATAEGSAFAHWMRYHKPRGDGDGWVASELVDGGRVRWERRRAQQGGVLALEWESLPWGGLVQSLGGRAVLEMQAWGIA